MDIIYSSVGIVRIFQTIKTIKRKVYHLYIVEHLVNLGLNGKLFTLVVDIDRLNSPCRPSCWLISIQMVNSKRTVTKICRIVGFLLGRQNDYRCCYLLIQIIWQVVQRKAVGSSEFCRIPADILLYGCRDNLSWLWKKQHIENLSPNFDGNPDSGKCQNGLFYLYQGHSW